MVKRLYAAAKMLKISGAAPDPSARSSVYWMAKLIPAELSSKLDTTQDAPKSQMLSF